MSSGVSEMTLEQQLGQLFMVGFDSATPTPEIIELIQRRHVGGIILFSRNCHSARQISTLTRDLQAAARDAGHRYPLLIAVDQENGLVQRLGDAITCLPGAMALGATRSEELTCAVAEATGRELRALGINMNLAPVADVNSNPANPVIGVRSFGEDPDLVSRLTAAAVRGYRASNVINTLKHFPGHGDTAVDSHLAMPVLPHALERLERVELAPFRAGIAAGADTVMLAHMRLLRLAPDDGLPASLSPAVTHFLRESLGFTGAVMTDCLEMDAITKTTGAAQGAVLALRAGVDIALISHTIEAQRAAIERARAAVASGELTVDTVRRAAERVRRLKSERLSWDRLPAPVETDTASAAPHQRLRDEAYRRAVTCARDTARQLPVRLAPEAQIIVVAQPTATITRASDTSYSRAHDALVESVRLRHARTCGIRLDDRAGAKAIAEALELAQAADLIILATLNASLDERQAALIQSLIATGRPIIGLAVCNPYDVAAFPQIQTYLATYEYTLAALSAAVGVLFGEFEPQGHLPISIRA